MGLVFVFIGGILGENYRYSVASVILFVITMKFLPIHNETAWAMGFSAVFGFVIFTILLTVVLMVVLGGAEILKNGLLN